MKLQIGLKLVLDSSEDDFLVAILISLSKLAAKSTLLLSEQVSVLIFWCDILIFIGQELVLFSQVASFSFLMQVDVLLFFLSQERTLRLRETALRCLNFIYRKGVCYSSVSTHVIRTLLRTLDEIELPSVMKCEALQILQVALS